MKKILLNISPDGTVTVEAEGYQDSSCKVATQPIIDALTGGKTASVLVTDKPEASLPAMGGAAGVNLF